MPAKKPRKKSGWKKKIAIGATVVAVGAGGYFVENAVKRRAAAERAIVQEYRGRIAESRIARNPGNWAKFCGIYKWNPATAQGAARIKLIERISQKTGVSPARVLLTIEANQIDRYQITALQNRIQGVDRQIASHQNKLLGLKGKQNAGQRAHFKSQIKQLQARKAQVGRVISVISALGAENQRIVTPMVKSVRNTPGSKRAIEKLAK